MSRSTLKDQIIVQAVFVVLLVAGIWLATRPKDKGEAAQGASQAAARGRGGRGGMRGRGGWGRPRSQATGQASVPVVITPVVRKPIEAFLLSTCTLEARVAVDVIARISEEVVAIQVEEGDRVKQGQLLARLNDREMALKARQEKAQLEQAKSVYGRLKRMFSNNIVSQEDLESAQVAYETAQVGYESATLTLSYTEVTSPIDGVVVERNVDVGQNVKANEALFRVANYDPILGRIHVPERDLSKVRVGLPVRVKVESVPEKEFLGKVSMISPVVDSDSGTVKVTFEIADPDKYCLCPGMFASTYLITETHDNALVLPKKSLVIESDLNEVFVVKDFLAAKIPAKYAKILKTGGKVTVVATPKPKAEKKPGAEAKAKPSGRRGGQQEKPGDATRAQGERTLSPTLARAASKPIIVETTFHSMPEPEESDETVECLIALPDQHGLSDGMTLELRTTIPAAPTEADTDAKEGLKAPQTPTLKPLALKVESYALRQLAMKRIVKVGFSEGNEIEILSGVEPGDRVVTVGHEDLKQGSAVRIIGTEAQGAVQEAKPQAAPQPEIRMPPASVIVRMRQGLGRNAKAKAEYEKRLKQDPTLATDDKKFMKFYGDMRKKGFIQSRRRGGR